MNKNNNDKGFTLVELLIVIVILGILATVTVFAVRGITDQGQENACNVESKTVLTAAEAYYAQEGTTPADVEALYSSGYLADDGAAANWDITASSATAGQVVTIQYVGGSDCDPA